MPMIEVPGIEECGAGNGSPSCKYKRNMKPDSRIGCEYSGPCTHKKEVKKWEFSQAQ